jgi:hypothetical protein
LRPEAQFATDTAAIQADKDAIKSLIDNDPGVIAGRAHQSATGGGLNLHPGNAQDR